MNAREKLLHNEVQNLNQIVQIVSFELTLMCDFMKEKFGISYERFRENYKEPNADYGMSSSLNNQSGKSTASSRNSTGARSVSKREEKRQKSDEDWNPSNDGSGSEDQASNDDIISDDDFGDTPSLSITSISGAKDLVPPGAELIESPTARTHAHGRSRSEIWKHFVISKFPDGKLHAACPRCKQTVSNKVERLQIHYEKCVFGTRKRLKRKKPAVKPEPAAAVNESVELDKRKVDEFMSSVTPSKIPKKEQEKSNDSDPDAAAHVPKPSKETTDHRPGKSADPVWDYFTKTIDSATDKVICKCKKCGLQVSAKVERIRKHFITCYELDKLGEVSNT